SHGWGDSDEGAVVEAELYDPDYSLFEPAASAHTVRRYHSVALLLPDGSVLKAGSTGGFGTHVDGTQYRFVGNETGERYLPKYMFLPRPAITGLEPAADKATVDHGGTFTVTASGGELTTGAEVAIIRPGSTTHGNNMDQRFVWLDTAVASEGSETAPWTFTATVPENPAAAPPGRYMVVVVTEEKVPSEAEWIHIAVPS
ncbi:galactose oxidase early set domain-containing protein, partial [Glycomyces tenuis]